MIHFCRPVERALPAIAVNCKALEMGKAYKVLGVFIQNNHKWDLLVLRQRRSTIWLAANPPIRFASSTAVPCGTPPFLNGCQAKSGIACCIPNAALSRGPWNLWVHYTAREKTRTMCQNGHQAKGAWVTPSPLLSANSGACARPFAPF